MGMARVDGDRWRHSCISRPPTEPPLDASARSTRLCLATGLIPNDSLYRELKGRHANVHILGDAFAPRRMVFATRQAFDLAQTLLAPVAS